MVVGNIEKTGAEEGEEGSDRRWLGSWEDFLSDVGEATELVFDFFEKKWNGM